MADDQPTYRIKDWNVHFENHQSRVLNHPRWVPFPNKHDGKSYKRIMRLPNGVAIFGAWVLIVEVASKMPVRGLLIDKDGQPLTAEDLADKTEAPQSIFEEALKILSDPKIGWISTESCTGNSQAVENSLSPSDCGTCKTALELKGREGNRIEKNRRLPQEKPRQVIPEIDPPFHGQQFIESLQTYKAVRKAARRPLIAESEMLLYDDLREWGEADATLALTGAAKAGHLQVLHPDKYRYNGNGNGRFQKTSTGTTGQQSNGSNGSSPHYDPFQGKPVI